MLSQISLGLDIKLAIFEIFQDGAAIKLNITLDKEDFLKAVGENDFNPHNSKLTEGKAFGYFDENLAITIDKQCTNFSITNIEFDEMTILFSGFLEKESSSIKEIAITNTCLINSFSNYDNIMKLEVNGKSRSFRLNQNRISTSAIYEDASF